MTDNEIIKAFEILEKFEFFGGQRAARELWFNKPTDIQNKDIGKFLREVGFLRQFINRQKEEIERLEREIENLESAQEISPEAKHFVDTKADKVISLMNEIIKSQEQIKAEAIKEFAERLKANILHKSYPLKLSAVGEIDNLVKEFTEGEQHESQCEKGDCREKD